jgi:hypothetical protein
MDYTMFLNILLNILFLFSAAGLVAGITLIIVKPKKSAYQLEISEEPKKPSKPKVLSALTKNELEELLFELEREKRTVTLGFSTMTDIHKEAAKARVQKIEAKLHYVRSQLANGA